MIKYKSVILYGIFGVITTLINVATYHVCFRSLGISNVISTIIAWVVAVTFAFLTNKSFVFNSRSWEKKAVIHEGLMFFGCRIGTGVIEVGMMYAFVDLLGLNGTVMKMITNVIVIVLNYVFSKLYVFKRKI
ncbi:MAG: GtrA family protein [Ruminococcaceae bacterium]|nr:GtrA family protein [Oscillospiraceae bacterium]